MPIQDPFFGAQGIPNVGVRNIDISGPEAQGISRFPLSASLSGVPFPVILGTAGSPAAGNYLHTFSPNTRAVEEIYLYAVNNSSTTMYLSMSFATGSAQAFQSSNTFYTPISPANGLTLVYPGLPHTSRNANHPLVLYVATTATGSMLVSGYAIRYYPRKPTDTRTADIYGFSA